MKYSKKNIFSRMFKIPVIKFEDHQLTSFAGLVIYQPLLQSLNLKAQLKKCFDHLKVSEMFGHHIIMLLLIFHLLLGFRWIYRLKRPPCPEVRSNQSGQGVPMVPGPEPIRY